MKLLVTGILALTILNPWAATVQAAASTSATVQVRAVIRPWIKFSANQPVSSYRVTSADIRRGYIDFPQALTLSVQTNIRDAIRFEISSGGPERILVQDGGTELTDAVRVEGQHPAVPVTRVLDMRVVLPEGTREGTYPLLIAMAPIAY
jgi:hypothetical protein